MRNKTRALIITACGILMLMQCGKTQCYTRRPLRADYFSLSMYPVDNHIKENVHLKTRFTFKNISEHFLIIPWFKYDYFYALNASTGKRYSNSDILWDRTSKVTIGENGYTSDDIHLCQNAEINDSVTFDAFLPPGSYVLFFDIETIPMKVMSTDTVGIDTISTAEVEKLMKPPSRNLESVLVSMANKDTSETRRLLNRIEVIDTGWFNDSTRGYVRAMVNRKF